MVNEIEERGVDEDEVEGAVEAGQEEISFTDLSNFHYDVLGEPLELESYGNYHTGIGSIPDGQSSMWFNMTNICLS